jgi:hypothetical protein
MDIRASIGHSIGEVSRVLKAGGALFISDPCPNECDAERFVDDYMSLKKDGHIRFYTKNEIDSYDLVETDTELFITERINNIMFCMRSL